MDDDWSNKLRECASRLAYGRDAAELHAELVEKDGFTAEEAHWLLVAAATYEPVQPTGE